MAPTGPTCGPSACYKKKKKKKTTFFRHFTKKNKTRTPFFSPFFSTYNSENVRTTTLFCIIKLTKATPTPTPEKKKNKNKNKKKELLMWSPLLPTK